VRPGLVTLVQPGRAIPATATAIHGITDAMTRGAPTTLDALRALEEACADDVLVGHGIGFDLAVIRRERRAHRLPPVGNPALDTMRLAAALYPAWRDVGLDAVAERLGVVIAGRHTPDGDAVAAGGILLRLLPTLATRGLRSLADVLWLQESVSLSGR
jgi:DNA polymerase III alpha subunit (gram-positive type)